MSEAFAPFVVRTCEAIASGSARAHRLQPTKGRPFSPFEIYDPFGLRNAVVPVFRQGVDGLMCGVGTAFHVDGFGNFLTAFHVVDFLGQIPESRPILFFSMHAVVFGTVRIPPDCFVPATEVFSSMVDAADPLAALRGKTVRQPAIDAAVLRAAEHGPRAKAPQTLPVRRRGWSPRLGEVVLAIGFPQLDLSEVSEAMQTALLNEGMCGAYGRITDIHPNGTSTSNPTPVFQVESDWPAGMSGGPVVNQRGEVVGLVSRSLRATPSESGVGYGVHFALAHDVELLTPTLDHDNPGWRNCWGVLAGSENQLVSVHVSRSSAEREATSGLGKLRVLHIANRIGTSEFVATSD
jgi:serine protease Do